MKRNGIVWFALLGIVYNDLYFRVSGVSPHSTAEWLTAPLWFGLWYLLVLLAGVALLSPGDASAPATDQPLRSHLLTPFRAGIAVFACYAVYGASVLVQVLWLNGGNRPDGDSTAVLFLVLGTGLVWYVLPRAVVVVGATWMADRIENTILARLFRIGRARGANIPRWRGFVAIALLLTQAGLQAKGPSDDRFGRARNQLQLMAYQASTRPREAWCSLQTLPLRFDDAERARLIASLDTAPRDGRADPRSLRALIEHPDLSLSESPCSNLELARGILAFDDAVDLPRYGQPPRPEMFDSVRVVSVALAVEPESPNIAAQYVCVRARAERNLGPSQWQELAQIVARQESRLDPVRRRAMAKAIGAVPADVIREPACVPWKLAP